MAKKKPKVHPIKKDEADRALYLDFEGTGASKTNPNPLPLLAGVLCESSYTVTVLDQRLEPLTYRSYIKYTPLDDFLGQLLKQAIDEQRRIAFWTSHEEKLFEERGYPPREVGFDVKIPTKETYLKKHFTQFRKDTKAFRDPNTSKTRKKILQPRAHSLLTIIAGELGLPRPSGFGAGLVGKWLRSILDQSDKKTAYPTWSRGSKAAVTKLIKHNCHDCCATKFILDYLFSLENDTLKTWLN